MYIEEEEVPAKSTSTKGEDYEKCTTRTVVKNSLDDFVQRGRL